MNKLWCIYIPGPDEHYAAPSEEAAQRMAERHNAAMADYFAKNPDPEGLYPSIKSVQAKVVEWPFEPNDHAEDIASFDFALWGLEGGAA